MAQPPPDASRSLAAHAAAAAMPSRGGGADGGSAREGDPLLADLAECARRKRQIAPDKIPAARRTDRTFMLMAVSANGYALEFAAEHLRADSEVVLAAVSQCGFALGFAAAALQGDCEVVLAAIGQDARALYRAPEALKSNREIILAAVRQDPNALRWATPALRADPELRPGRAEANPLAVPGARAPVIFVDALATAPDGGFETQARLLSGRLAAVQVAAGATVGDIATAAMRELGLEDRYAHVTLAGRAVGPFEWDVLVASLSAASAAGAAAVAEVESNWGGRGEAERHAAENVSAQPARC